MDFRTQLLHRASGWDMAENPLVQGLQSGRFSREALALYADRMRQLVDQFPILLVRLAAICPDRGVRQHVLENLLEEEAFFFQDGRLTGDDTASHSALIRRFQAELPPLQEDAWSDRNQQLAQWLARGSWPAVAGFLFIGIEHNAPTTFKKIIPALRTHYAMGRDALEYFTEHVGADAVHSARGADLLAAYCRDPESQTLALEGASLGGRSWYLLHSLCARDMSRMNACPTPHSH